MIGRRGTGPMLALAGTASALLGMTIGAAPTPRLVWNASASAPIGLYVVDPGASIALGDFVIATPPPAVRSLAVHRQYLGRGIPLVKQVAALPGDEICASGSIIRVRRTLTVTRRAVDALGRPMPGWSGCHILQPDQYFLLMPAVASSFDGRYFGPVAAHFILGRAHLLWPR